MGWDFYLFYLCSDPDPAPLISNKVLKAPVGLLQKIDARIITFLDDMVIIAQTPVKIIQVREALFHLVKNIQFFVNVKKSQLTLAKEVKVLGLIILSQTVTLALLQDIQTCSQYGNFKNIEVWSYGESITGMHLLHYT